MTTCGLNPSHAGTDSSSVRRSRKAIPSNDCRKVAISHDIAIYIHRNRIEWCLNKLKRHRRFATR